MPVTAYQLMNECLKLRRLSIRSSLPALAAYTPILWCGIFETRGVRHDLKRIILSPPVFRNFLRRVLEALAVWRRRLTRPPDAFANPIKANRRSERIFSWHGPT